MLRNYFLVAIRSLRRERLYAAINVIGLAVALTLALLALAYVKHERSYDRFHSNSDRLFRINYLIPQENGRIQRSAGTAFVLAPILREQLPDIATTVATADLPEAIVQYDRHNFREPVFFADSQFFSTFSFPLIDGDPSTALQNPNSVVLTEKLATKYFGDVRPVGKIITISIRGKQELYEVTGVCRNVPGNSSQQFDLVIPLRKLFSLYEGVFKFGWNLTWPTTYVLLRDGVSVADVNAKLEALALTLPVDADGKLKILFGLQPIADMHFDHAIDNAPPNASRPLYSFILAGLALLVLLLACINFMTLAIGRSQTRTKEVGIRKVLGARSDQVIGRFLGEAILLCLIATLIAFVTAELLLPAFNELSGKQISPSIWMDATTILSILLLVIFTGLVAGGYPAIVLARARLRDSVKGKAAFLTTGAVTRTLVVFQFWLSIALIVSTFVMSNQIDYLQSVPIGFDKEHLLLVKLGGTGEEKLKTVQLLRNQLSGNPSVRSISAASRSFDGTGMANGDYLPDSTIFVVYANPADEHFVKTMGLTIIEGSNFTGNVSADSLEPLLVNETLVRRLKWSSAIGQRVPGITDGRVIGVVNDFNFRSLSEPIEPVVIPFADPQGWGAEVRFAYLRISPERIPATIESIRKAWQAVAPNFPCEFQFMDDHIDAQYRFEQRWWKIIGMAAVLAVLIACFGTFGLTALAVARRRKEISVRKVLGASSQQIVTLMSSEFLKLAIIGNLLAWPAAYFATRHWLSGFAYHLDPSLLPFLLAAILTVTIVLLTVLVQAVRAAQANPVESLRYE